MEYSKKGKREQQLALDLLRQGVTQGDYPQYGTSFWGNSANNYGFGFNNIAQNAQSHPAMNMTPMTGLPQQQPMQENNTQNFWDKLKNWGNNFADATQAATVGYTTGATLGNFDEAMGVATAALSGNKANYALGRDATRQLQNDLQKRHPYLYGGAEILGATAASAFISPSTVPVVAGVGYADNLENVPENFVKNLAVLRATRGIQKLPFASKNIRNFLQNTASWYLLDKESEVE